MHRMARCIYSMAIFCVLLSLVVNAYAYPDTTQISIPAGSAVPGCEETNECYTPYEITVGVGDTVTWSNDDTAAHTVTSGISSYSSIDGFWRADPNGKFDSSLIFAGETFSHEFKASGEYPYFCEIHPWMAGTVIVEGTSNEVDFKDQDSNDEIRFSGYRGSLINCETFSYEVPIYVNSETNVPIVIEIIDPDGNVAGRDEFESINYDSPRIIEMNWGKDGRYLIQVHYKGAIYQEDFSYDKMPTETFQGNRNSCLKQEYITSIRDETWTLFNFLTNPKHDGFEKKVRIAEKFLRDSDAKDFLDIYSEKVLNSILSGTKQVDDIKKLYSMLPEFRVLLADLVEPRVISIFQDSEARLTINPDITLDEKTELIFELRKVRDNAILTQRQYAEQYAESAYMIYHAANKLQENIERNKELTSIRIQADKEKELQIAQEKESIRQEILSQNLIPEWIKNNAKWWSEGTISDSDFTGGIQHLIQEKIIDIPDLPEQESETVEEKIPDWVKNNAGWWANGLISEDDFLNGIKYLIKEGIIHV